MTTTPMVLVQEDEDEEEEGDFKSRISSSSIVSSHSDFRILPRAMMNEQETNVSTRELERWLANDYERYGWDRSKSWARLYVKSRSQEVVRVSVDETLTGPSPDSSLAR